jgi:hypothetical protein
VKKVAMEVNMKTLWISISFHFMTSVGPMMREKISFAVVFSSIEVANGKACLMQAVKNVNIVVGKLFNFKQRLFIDNKV